VCFGALVEAGQVSLFPETTVQQEKVSATVYPGIFEKSPWCRGQIVYYGGSTAAERNESHIGYPEGYLGDMWIYNISSNTISEIQYDRIRAYPVRRRGTKMRHETSLLQREG
jgi:hypothetical protein